MVRLIHNVWLCAAVLTVLASAPGAFGQSLRPPLTAAQLVADYADWRELEPGLELRAFPAPQASDLGDQLIVVLRIDPAHFEFKIMIVDALGEPRKAAPAWAVEHDLVAVTNAGMFAADAAARPVGFTKADGLAINPSINGDNTIFAAQPNGQDRPSDLPSVQIIDRQCDDFAALRPHYADMLQSIRMISCTGENVWSQQNRQWSTAALATDTQGRVLFIHARSPYSVHDFIAMLQALPLNIERAMYLEGGPESTLYADSGAVRLQRYGSFETGFFESDDNNYPWPLPNVIGVTRKAASQPHIEAEHTSSGEN